MENVIPSFGPLSRRTAAFIEIDYPFHWIAEVCDDEANPGKQFALVPFHLGNHSSRNIPTLGLINEVMILDDGLLRGPLGRPYQQVCYFPLKNVVCWKPVERQRKWDTIGAEINGGFR